MVNDNAGNLPASKVEAGTTPNHGASAAPSQAVRRRLFGLAAFALGLSFVFLVPLWDLFGLALRSDFNSYILLVPLVTGYLAWLKRKDVLAELSTGWLGFLLAVFGGGLVLLVHWLALRGGHWDNAVDRLWLWIAGYVSFLCAGVHLCLGHRAAGVVAFPLGFLFFMVPLPGFIKAGMEQALQHGSAEAAYWLLKASGTPVFQHGLYFELPGLTLHVAPECSGIRSSYVLFMASLIAGHLFLQSKWKKGLLALLVLPIGVLRNAFRILTIALLTIHVDPEIIHGPLHRRGGPLFFGLSLVPLFLVLVLLRRSEGKRRTVEA